MDESRAERTARAVVHAEKTLLAGFTTVRDLGTEGAGYDDVGLKEAIEKGIIPGPRMICATRAIVASGSYGPKLGNLNHAIVRGAAEADGGNRFRFGVVELADDELFDVDLGTIPSESLDQWEGSGTCTQGECCPSSKFQEVASFDV